MIKKRTITSQSAESTTPSIHCAISSNALRRNFQFESPKFVAISVGINSAARASESSGLCLYLNVSRLPDAAGTDGLVGLEEEAAAAATAAAGGFLACYERGIMNITT